MQPLNTVLAAAATLLLAACSFYPAAPGQSGPIERGRLPPPDLTLNVERLGPCTDGPDRALRLTAGAPVTVLVHGCFSSAGRFRNLSEVFALHGQQAVCYSYDDRARLTRSAAGLSAALGELSRALPGQRLTVIGHSQGGLIARKSLVQLGDNPLQRVDAGLRLVTISSPFAGIEAASHCGSTLARVLSLGITMGICQLVTGSKWQDITYNSPFITEPGSFLRQVDRHVKITTDESGSCRRRDAAGQCLEDDFVFGLDEQYYPRIDRLAATRSIEVDAGHVEIVGYHRQPPLKLIAVLQRQGILNRTDAGQRERLAAALARLY